MATYGKVFERYELKYILTKQDYEFIKEELSKHMHIDKYGRTTIQSIYYDTPTNLLVRRSIEKPKFKEKIRLRSYGLANETSPCYLELKRKCQGLVYKRRVQVCEQDAETFFERENVAGNGQIARELACFRDHYKKLQPTFLILYERESYYKEGSEVRVTFDFNPRYRVEDVNLHTSLEGIPLLDEDTYLMEIKVLQNMPLWLAHILTKGKIRRGSFSKIGKAYMLEKLKGNIPNSKELEIKEENLWKTYSIQYSTVQ